MLRWHLEAHDMPSPTLGFLHTLPSNEQTFAALLAELAPGLPARHRVDPALLVEARRDGAQSEGVRRLVGEAVLALVREGASVVVCTCSTIGDAAESTAPPAGAAVMRIDRPMAELALTFGSRVLVAASLDSTFPPTIALLNEAAQAAGRPIQITRLLCEQAWAYFERGDLDGYARAIAADIAKVVDATRAPGDVDVIVLAQASMAPAARLMPDLKTPILSSPRLGLQAAIEKLKLLATGERP